LSGSDRILWTSRVRRITLPATYAPSTHKTFLKPSNLSHIDNEETAHYRRGHPYTKQGRECSTLERGLIVMFVRQSERILKFKGIVGRIGAVPVTITFSCSCCQTRLGIFDKKTSPPQPIFQRSPMFRHNRSIGGVQDSITCESYPVTLLRKSHSNGLQDTAYGRCGSREACDIE
jgi:hypothetical protein